jgi:hypothetical protein
VKATDSPFNSAHLENLAIDPKNAQPLTMPMFLLW